LYRQVKESLHLRDSEETRTGLVCGQSKFVGAAVSEEIWPDGNPRAGETICPLQSISMAGIRVKADGRSLIL